MCRINASAGLAVLFFVLLGVIGIATTATADVPGSGPISITLADPPRSGAGDDGGFEWG